ncbi:MAG: UbiA prenyltransferase family protein [Planctomycetota bacterium]|nr:UbiA prenyltransferase family protein [Planctomycetota bacterium]MDA1105049.1 UbiA prenyltransferase family protein [Planctomycetota bacterium]
MPAFLAIVRLLRPGDWTKSVFVLIPAIFWLASTGRDAGTEAQHAVLCGSLVALVAFCAVSSGWYCINDALDAAEDRQHPTKRGRPVASGAVPVRVAWAVGLSFVVGGLAIASLAGEAASIVIGAYIGLQVLYNLRLKRTAYVDVATIAAGFCLRAVAGAVASDIPMSAWLLICCFFLTLFLGLVKRLCDLSAADQWKQRAGYGDARELDWLLGIAAAVTLLAYLMYTTSEHAQTLYKGRAYGLAMLSPLVLLALHRFHRRAVRGLSDSPLAALREDPWMCVAVLGWGVCAGVVLFCDCVEPMLSRLLL